MGKPNAAKHFAKYHSGVIAPVYCVSCDDEIKLGEAWCQVPAIGPMHMRKCRSGELQPLGTRKLAWHSRRTNADTHTVAGKRVRGVGRRTG